MREGQSWRILVRAALTGADTAYAIALALARWTTLIQRPQLTLSTRELEDIASRLLLPSDAVQLARLAGLTVEQIASSYVCPRSVVTARMRAAAPTKSGVFRRLQEVG